MKKILILGASGFLGRNIYSFLKNGVNLNQSFDIRGTYYKNNFYQNFQYLNLYNKEDVRSYLLKYEPDLIIFLAGNKNVKQCEEDFKEAFEVNVVPLLNIIDVLEQNLFNTKILYISSDYVFDGRKGNNKDIDSPNPSTNYGRLKFICENLLSYSRLDYKVIRTAAVMGKGGVFFDWLVNALSNGKEVKLFNNTYFSPTPIQLLNESLLKLIYCWDEINKSIVHIVSENKFSRYEFGLMMADLLNIDRKLIRAERLNFQESIFQADLSLEVSDFFKAKDSKPIQWYLKREVLYDQNN